MSLNLFAYLNCSQPYDINETPYTGPLSLSAVPVTLAQASQYTNKPVIPLAFSFVNSPKDMYLTLVAGCASGGDWAPYASKVSVPWPHPDGQATAYAKFRNFHLVETPCYDVTVIVDTTPPTILMTAQPGLMTNSKTASFTMDVKDSLSGLDYLECSLDQAKFLTCPPNATFNNLADGNHSFAVRAYDKAGNASEVLTTKWLIDTKAPSLSVTAYPPPITNLRNAHFEFSASDTAGSGLSKIVCQLGTAAEQVCQSPVDFTGLPDGNLSFTISAIDQAGNRASQKISWIVDTTPPTLHISSSPKNWSNSKNAQFIFAFDDAGGSGLDHYMCLVDKVPATGTAVPIRCNSGITYSGYADGSYSFTVLAYDRAGNVSQPAQVSWTIDTVLPTITLTSSGLPKTLTQVNSAYFSFTASDNIGVDHITCQLNNQAPQDCSVGYVTLSQIPDGATTFKAIAYDAAGNSATLSYSWSIDTTSPIVTILSGPSNGMGRASVVFVFSATDGAGSGIDHFECSIDYQTSVVCKSPYTPKLTGTGLHFYSITALDRAGNRGRASGTWTP